MERKREMARAGGFTLIEMVVVLLILSLLTHLAVRELGRGAEAKMRRQADRQLEELQGAVWRMPPGAAPEGFLADMGRLPRATASTNEYGREVLSLSELWKMPDDARPFALRRAVSSNLVVSASVSDVLADDTVVVPCGWRGPYLHMPFGGDRLLDVWGNPFETLDDAGFARLLAEDGSPVARGAPVAKARHLGADARPDGDVTPGKDADRDGETRLAPSGGGGALAVTANFMNSAGPAAVSGEVRCRWYMPCGGAITGAVESVSLSGGTYASFAFEGMSPGTCVVAVDVGGEPRARRSVVVPPGGTAVDMKVYLP